MSHTWAAPLAFRELETASALAFSQGISAVFPICSMHQSGNALSERRCHVDCEIGSSCVPVEGLSDKWSVSQRRAVGLAACFPARRAGCDMVKRSLNPQPIVIWSVNCTANSVFTCYPSYHFFFIIFSMNLLSLTGEQYADQDVSPCMQINL